MLLLNSVPSLLIDQVLRDIYDNRRTQVSFATPMDFFLICCLVYSVNEIQLTGGTSILSYSSVLFSRIAVQRFLVYTVSILVRNCCSVKHFNRQHNIE